MTRTQLTKSRMHKASTASFDEAWELIKRPDQDEADGEEIEASEDFLIMREREDAHLTAAIVRYVVTTPEDEIVAEVVLPHLCRCSWCRGTLHQSLVLMGVGTAHLAYMLIAEAEDWARWDAAGRRGTQSARESLKKMGVNVVYERDGIIVEESPHNSAQETEASPNVKVASR